MFAPLSPPVRRLFGALALAALSGCAVLPPMPARVPTVALDDTDATELGRLARASLSGTHGDESGFRLLPTGDYAFDARITLARRAERTLDVQYYLIQQDTVGKRFLRELRDAALRGVRVRILIDDLYTGGEEAMLAGLGAYPNVEIRLFNPLPVRGSSLAERLFFSLPDFGRINHRMHNKLFVADNRFAVSGGRNIADEYFMRNRAANFIDMDVLSAGPVVRQLSAVFDRYWASDYAYPLTAVIAPPADAAAARQRFDALVRDATPDPELLLTDPLGGVSIDAYLDAGRVPLAPATARVFADAPEKVRLDGPSPSATTVTRSVLAVFEQARSEVIIASPYFIPGPVGMAAMKDAIDHHVRIAVFTNSLGATDEPLVHWRYARYRRDMLKLGVEVYELSPDLARASGHFGDFGRSFGRLHAKVAVIDRRRLFVGSMNLDPRSAWSNTESGLLIDSPGLAEGIYTLVGRDRLTSVYRLRLDADGERVEWVTTDAQGHEKVLTDEPHGSWLLDLKLWLLSTFASEEML